LTVLFVDVNHFKHVNDTDGHAAGDRVLVHVAETLRAHIREFDLLCRWGGDEFVILMACDETDAMSKSRDLQRVCAESLASSGWPATLGLSIGVAGVPAGTVDIGPFVRLADERMYADKLERARS
jgi:diguanylate cyclase (GGDEF)-like protein